MWSRKKKKKKKAFDLFLLMFLTLAATPISMQTDTGAKKRVADGVWAGRHRE